MREYAGRVAVDADEDRGRAIAAQLFGAALRAPTRRSSSSRRKRRVAERDALAVDGADARPCRSASRSRRASAGSMPRSRGGGHDRGGQRMLARRSRLAARRSTSLSSNPAAGTTAVTAGLPSVSVPVLSTTSVSTFSMRSSASAFLISTPASRAAPDADHDRHGRRQPERAGAGDDEHRHRRDQRVGEARLRAPDAPRRRRRGRATAITAGTNQPRHVSASRWIGARLRCASATIATMRASIVSRADFLGAHHEARRLRSSCRRSTLSPMRLCPPAWTRRSPSIRRRRCRPSMTTPSTGIFSPGRTRSRSPT